MDTPWPDLPRPVNWKKSPKGGNAPTVGRKFCSSCGRWKLLVDFQCMGWTRRGVAWKWQARCQTCYRVHKRIAGGHQPRRIGRPSLEERRRLAREAQTRRLADPARRERRREYDRIYKEAQRRAAGIKPRPFTTERSVPRAVGNSNDNFDAASFLTYCDRWVARWERDHAAEEISTSGWRALARTAGISPRSLRRIRLTGRVHIATVDRVLVALNGPMLNELYPVASEA